MRWFTAGRRASLAPPPGPLADLAARPVPPMDTPLEQVELLAVDLETTGLRPGSDEVLSVGFVPVRAGHVLLGQGRVHRVRPQGEVGDSAVVHGLTDDALVGAPTLDQVLPQVLQALAGEGPAAGGSGQRRVLLAHFAQIEVTFLRAATRAAYGTWVPLPVVDTVEVQRRLVLRGGHHHELRQGALRLDECRRAHHLPRYRAHDALTDAIACAELFLAQCAALSAARDRPLVLGDVAQRMARR